ncbi:MAG: rRNA pseudouridine synthase [Myxococcaceae bacterium]|nr:rRNA pseudouridine synthase [Myxococcaceae bacterium]
MAQERLQKYLAQAGIASRRAAELLISAGRVKVNGAVVTALGTRVDSERDTVLVDGQSTRIAADRTYVLLYKPPGVVTTLSDPQGRPTVKSLLAGVSARVFPVGRLDIDAEGALLLTDDGELAQRLTHPKYQVPRTYLSLVKGTPSDADLARLVSGVRLEDGPAKAAQAERFAKEGEGTWVRLVVHEGRQHLVKKLCAAIGFPVERLFRPLHAGLSLGALQPGQFRQLTAEEVASVKKISTGEGGQAAPPTPALTLPGPRIDMKAPPSRAAQGKPLQHKAPRRPSR